MSDLTGTVDADLKQRTVTGLLWSAGARTGSQLLQFAVTVVLARLLTPADFGLIAMIASVTGFLILFVDFGLAAALIQRGTLTERHRSSAFWMNLAAGLALATLVAALAPALASFFNEPRLVELTLVLSLNFVVGSLAIVQSALLQRSMNFRRLGAIEIASTLVGGAAAIATAVAGYGVWSLIVQLIANTAVRTTLLWMTSYWRPRLIVDRAAIRELWRFSGPMLGFTTINFWSRNADNFLIGKFVGANALGIYSRAYNTMLMPLYQIAAVASRVMFPALSGIQEDRKRVRRVYLRAVAMIALVGFPTLMGLLVVADRFILVLYGDKWVEAVPLLRVLCVVGMVQCPVMTLGWIFTSQGRMDLMFRWSLVTSAITVAAFAIGLHWGAMGVATAYLVVNLAYTYPGVVLGGRLIGMSFTDFALAVYKPLVLSVAMGAIVWLSGRALPQDWPPSAELILLVSIGVASYGALLRLLSPAGYRELVALRRGAT